MLFRGETGGKATVYPSQPRDPGTGGQTGRLGVVEFSTLCDGIGGRRRNRVVLDTGEAGGSGFSYRDNPNLGAPGLASETWEDSSVA